SLELLTNRRDRAGATVTLASVLRVPVGAQPAAGWRAPGRCAFPPMDRLLIVRTEGMSARRRVAVSVLPGVLVGAGVFATTRQWDVAAVAGWDVAGLVFLVWTWREVWGLDEVASARRAEREDPTAGVADLILTA